MFYVYLLTFANGTYYYGSSVNPSRRYKEHKSLNEKKTNKKNRLLCNVWNKYGDPKMEIVGIYQTSEDMIDAEQFYINVSIGDRDNLNINKKADRPPSKFGYKHSAETIEKMKSKTITEEHKSKVSAFMKGRPKPEGAGVPQKPVLVWNETEQKTFSGIREAGRQMLMSCSGMKYRIKTETCGRDGWFVRYLNNDEITLNNEE